MPVIYRRPDPADTAAAQTRLARLAQAGARPTEAAAPPVHEVVPAHLIAEQPPNRATPRASAGAAPPVDPGSPKAGATPVGLASQATGHQLDNPPPEFETPWGSRWSRYLPSNLRGARLDPGRRGIAAVAAVAVLAAAFAAFGVWRSRPQPIEVVGPAVTAPTAAPSASAAPTVVVAVAGGVRRPGLFTLPVGARVADAITAAGGVRPGVSIGLLNLARRLVDGEQVIVGVVAGAQPNPPAGPTSGPGTPLNLNTATLQQLDELPGVGPVLAQRILDYRTQHGAFRSVDQLREVGGIGEAKFADLRALVAV